MWYRLTEDSAEGKGFCLVSHLLNVGEEDLLARFDTVWAHSLHAAIASADICSLEDARRKIKPDQQRWLDKNQEQREFWLEGGLFVAQTTANADDTHELTQLWFVRSSDIDPRRLFITFATVEIRREFDKIAVEHGWKPEELGEKLLLDFMESATKKKFR